MNSTAPGAATALGTGVHRWGVNFWLTALLDRFLSEALRKAPPSELHRHRVLIGATLVGVLYSVAYLALIPFTTVQVPTLLLVICFLGALGLARRARSLTPLALLLCLLATAGQVLGVFMNPHPEGGFHAACMLIPAFAVFVLGTRLGFVITLVLAVCMGVLNPLYRLALPVVLNPFSRQEVSVLLFCTGICLLGSWVLSALYSTSRDAAHEALEQALKTLRESEGKLLSLVENTDDLVFSVDTRHCLITANSVFRRLHLEIQGWEALDGQPLVFSRLPELGEHMRRVFDEALAGRRSRFEQEFMHADARLVLDVSVGPILGGDGGVVGATVFGKDITARKLAETRLGEMHRSLVEVSRYAGRAEVATGVLHNVGNTLNSVNTSASLIEEKLRQSRVTGLRKAASLLEAHAPELSTFFASDPRGQQLPGYLLALAGVLETERESMRQEVGALMERVEHIKSIVSMQQRHARAVGVVEPLPVARLIEEALRLNADAFERRGLHIEREYAEVPLILVDRHNLLQILINLLSNARDALLESAAPDKCLRIRVRLSAQGDQLVIEFSDNGVGIEPENLTRLFSQGFTTKMHGHGFGLHISALTATQMRGRLSCSSDGLGKGATFQLVLPVDGPHEDPAPGHTRPRERSQLPARGR